MTFLLRTILLSSLFLLIGCSKLYYSSLENMGVPKREVMIYRVEKARDTQEATKAQFKSALEQFMAVTRFSGGDLETVYKKLNTEYEDSLDQARLVKKRIDDIDDVSKALFEEWEAEINQYSSASLKRSSQNQLNTTKRQYRQLMQAMKHAESKLSPVLTVFKDQVLFLKHNLNARAISSLKNELTSIQSDVSSLIAAMEQSIDEANSFIATMAN